MTTRTGVWTAIRGIGGAIAMAIMLWLVLATPGVLSNRGSTVPRMAREARQ